MEGRGGKTSDTLANVFIMVQHNGRSHGGKEDASAVIRKASRVRGKGGGPKIKSGSNVSSRKCMGCRFSLTRRTRKSSKGRVMVVLSYYPMAPL
jgi:hypothetical protein